MTFNFDKFMTALSGMIAPIGEAVTLLHPGNTNEALKIKVGVALLQGIAETLHASLHQAQMPAPEAPAPAPTPAPEPAPAPTSEVPIPVATPAPEAHIPATPPFPTTAPSEG
jgi:hypothetical protein